MVVEPLGPDQASRLQIYCADVGGMLVTSVTLLNPARFGGHRWVCAHCLLVNMDGNNRPVLTVSESG